jgi:hypothetical protein
MLRAVGVGRMNVKYNAHALTLFAVFWSLPSSLVILALVLGYQDRTNNFNVTPSGIARLCGMLAVLGIHLWSIIALIYYWCTERKRKVTVLHTGGEVDS